MKVVVIGGSGLIGAKVVKNLQERGHEVVSASRSTGVNTVTGQGLALALVNAEVVIDVANSPSFEEKAALEFFEKSGANLFREEAKAKVKHHIGLSVVGTDRLLSSGYFRAKLAQENLIKSSNIPYTLLRATQFFEFVGAIADSATVGKEVRLPHALLQPIAAEDVASTLADIVDQAPKNGMVELAGPELIPLDELVGRFLSATRDGRKVVTDSTALYFGLELNDQTLNPGPGARIGKIHFNDWLKKHTLSAIG